MTHPAIVVWPPLSRHDRATVGLARESAEPSLWTVDEAEQRERFAYALREAMRAARLTPPKLAEKIGVAANRALIWVESRYSTASVMKDLMYELWEAVSGEEPDRWEGDYVFRFGSDSTDGYLQSTTSSTLWDTIADQLQWERQSKFVTHGRLCC